MGIIAIRLLNVRLAWQPHNDCLCPTNHNTAHLARSIDLVHTDAAVWFICDETHKYKYNNTLSSLVCCWLRRVCDADSDATMCSNGCYCTHWVLTLHCKQENLRKRVLVSCEGSCEVIWNLVEKQMIDTYSACLLICSIEYHTTPCPKKEHYFKRC